VIFQDLRDQISGLFRTSAHIQDFSVPDFSFFIIQDFSGPVGTLSMANVDCSNNTAQT